MERTRYFRPGDKVKSALARARSAADTDPSLRPGIGKQLRRDVGNYLWRETGYNILLAVGLGGAIEVSVGVSEPLAYPYLSNIAAGFFVLGALARESIALINAGRIATASLQYRRNPQQRFEPAFSSVIE